MPKFPQQWAVNTGLTTGSRAAEPQKESSLLPKALASQQHISFWQLKGSRRGARKLESNQEARCRQARSFSNATHLLWLLRRRPQRAMTRLMQASRGLWMKMCQPAFALFIYIDTSDGPDVVSEILNSRIRNISQTIITKTKTQGQHSI